MAVFAGSPLVRCCPRFLKRGGGNAKPLPFPVAIALSSVAVLSAVEPGLSRTARSISPSGVEVETHLAQTQRRTLQYQDSGADVIELQQRLNELGYLNIQPTGFFGVLTQEAVLNFQADRGLEVDGDVGDRTWDRLLALTSFPSSYVPVFPPNTWPYTDTVVLRPGDRGDAVERLQAALNEIGVGEWFRTGGINEDGRYGSQTRDAVTRFQQVYNVDAPILGEVDTTTATALQEVLEGSRDVLGRPGTFRLERGDSGLAVWELQRALSETPQEYFPDSPYYSGTVNGEFDFATERAVRQFQRDNNLRQTGIANEATLEVLFEDYNYVVVVPVPRNDALSDSLEEIRDAIAALDWWFRNLNIRDLSLFDDSRGPYVQVGQFRDRSDAESRVDELRDEGLSDARVVYFRHPFDRRQMSRAEFESRYGS
ncbi:peptidoglycan-binding protein [Baaleninema sp.]|uniref:peptidoglycan-binding protein n=1 Tax=Baaleninema sp. TaxID=3101197 RepID=UPI003D02CC72